MAGTVQAAGFLPRSQIWLPGIQGPWRVPEARSSMEVGCSICSLCTHRGGEAVRLLSWGRGTPRQLVSREIWDALLPCEAPDHQKEALTAVQHRTLSVSERLLSAGVLAQLRLMPTSSAFLRVSCFLQLHSLPRVRQHESSTWCVGGSAWLSPAWLLHTQPPLQAPAPHSPSCFPQHEPAAVHIAQYINLLFL